MLETCILIIRVQFINLLQRSHKHARKESYGTPARLAGAAEIRSNRNFITTFIMPWQIVPPLLIIGGAFTATGLLLNGFDYVTLGRVSEILETRA